MGAPYPFDAVANDVAYREVLNEHEASDEPINLLERCAVVSDRLIGFVNDGTAQYEPDFGARAYEFTYREVRRRTNRYD